MSQEEQIPPVFSSPLPLLAPRSSRASLSSAPHNPQNSVYKSCEVLCKALTTVPFNMQPAAAAYPLVLHFAESLETALRSLIDLFDFALEAQASVGQDLNIEEILSSLK